MNWPQMNADECRSTADSDSSPSEVITSARGLAPGDVNEFLAERCVASEDASEFQAILRTKYVALCDAAGKGYMSNTDFEEALDCAGFAERRENRLGLRLKLILEMADCAARVMRVNPKPETT